MPLKTCEEILNILRREKPALQSRFKVKSIGLFGSYARSEQTKASDVDILVDVDPSIGLDFVTLAAKLEEAVGLPVELVSRRAVKPRHLKVIEQDLLNV